MIASEINAFLQLVKLNRQRIADKLGIQRSKVSQVINGLVDDPETETSIASLFAMTREEFFGEDHRIATIAKRIDKLKGKGTTLKLLEDFLNQNAE
jgi:hypothetical protein